METCLICSLAKNGEFTPMEGMPGGTIKILRETPTTGILRLSVGAVEPANHHTFGHEIVMMSGRIRFWDLSTKEEFDLGRGDFLFTPAGNVHRAKCLEESEVFIRWEGEMDMFIHEDLETAKKEIAKVLPAK